MKKTVQITPCDTYEKEIMKQAVQAVFKDVDWIKPGMTIGCKVNLLAASEPEQTVTTHPVLVQCIAEYLLDKQAKVIIGDSPGGTFTKSHLDKVYEKTKMTLAQRSGAILNENFNEKQASFLDAKVMKTFSYTSWLDDCDVIINVCKMKTHAMMTMTGAVKNLFGTIPGTTKPKYHMRFDNHHDFADMLVDLNEYFHPALVIMDCVDAMEGNGPSSGSTRHVGCLLSSTSPYALDMTEAAMMGLQREDVPTLQAAYQRGLGPKDIHEVNLDGDINPYLIRDFQPVNQPLDITFGNQSVLGKLISRLGKSALQSRPQVHESECISCQKCKEICPARAITMKNNIPDIDREICIRCFCCQEFCPTGAMKAHQSFISKVLNQMEK